MTPPLLYLPLLCCLSFFHRRPLAAANLHSSRSIFWPSPSSEPTSLSTGDTPPTTYFEVTNPISLPNTKPCSYLVLQHDFAFTYGKPPVFANYTPPWDCPSQKFARIVLEWTATCKGRQFDRIFGVWLGGVEILRSCTAEPRATGIVWTAKKDITRYHSLLMNNQILAVYMGNLVDSTYTGVYHVNVSLHFYPTEEGSGYSEVGSAEMGDTFGSGADLILPISRNIPLNDGLWFEIENSTNVVSKVFKIPQNAYKAVLEVYVSYHENDEFWYGNYPNEYISANNLTGAAGNGPFREVLVSLDNMIIGAVFPFTVVYTGGINPLLWRPITGIGSFDLPSYDIEITPLLGKILDGNAHEFAFSVTNALNVWYIDANLHVWLDKGSEKTQGKVIEHSTSPLSMSLLSNFTGLDGLFITNATRSVILSGWVNSSHGLLMTKSLQRFEYTNSMVMKKNGNLQILNQEIFFNSSVNTNMPSCTKSLKAYRLYMYLEDVDKGNGSSVSVSNVSLGINEKKQMASNSGLSTTKLKNAQKAQGYVLVKGNLVASGLGSTQQKYDFVGDKSCYFRSISSSNYTILHDKESNSCADNRPHARGKDFIGTKFIGGRKRLI
ncbi:peptide-N4-(N-acetyl-beta-glucosaminyl)asparagine amidase A-like [Henckelia pumila]|uniref:peptide-N4-(N-acetyl-beta- glucosaminyl)asparagine amidase A-like n=1 Tax=Henckelia pumila TaxID=405737 RepID=UPI003C6DF0AA